MLEMVQKPIRSLLKSINSENAKIAEVRKELKTACTKNSEKRVYLPECLFCISLFCLVWGFCLFVCFLFLVVVCLFKDT